MLDFSKGKKGTLVVARPVFQDSLVANRYEKIEGPISPDVIYGYVAIKTNEENPTYMLFPHHAVQYMEFADGTP